MVLGIVAEYNPFHNGHKYQIDEAKKRTGANCVVAIMSGNFVQRGDAVSATSGQEFKWLKMGLTWL